MRFGPNLPLILTGFAAACGGDSVAPPDDEPPARRPAAIRVVSGDEQHGIAGQPLLAPIVLQVLDSADVGLPGQSVAFLVVAGHGSISVDTGQTDAYGMVFQQWTLGPTVGEPQTLYIRLPDDGSGAPVIYTTVTANADPAPTGVHFTSVAAGTGYTCGATSEGRTYCWGAGNTGMLHTIPTALGGDVPFASIELGFSHACGLTLEGAAYCWGANQSGQLGNGSTAGRDTPAPVSGGLTFQQIALGGSHTCGITLAGAAYCWGDNGNETFGGQLGDGTIISRSLPTRVTGDLTFRSIAAGYASTCGLTLDGAIYCWGSILGEHNGRSQLEPTTLAGGILLTSISSNFAHMCGLTSQGAAYCWGDGLTGELGDGNFSDSPVPVAVAGGLTFSAVEPGYHHTCGLTTAGDLACWGWDDQYTDSREFNDGSSINSGTPVIVPGGQTFVQISEGLVHGCGLTADGSAYCWFDNGNGQLGDGTQTGSYRPVPVH